MTIEFKDKDQLVQDVITSISDKIGDIDFSDGEPLKTIIEAIMNELDLQYWQLEQVYNIGDIDKTFDEDLDNLVKLLGITRIPATNSIGRVKFYRETPATMDYAIPSGTLVETLPDSEGNIIRFETIENVILELGQLYIYANIKSIEPGTKSNVVANKIVVINNPPIGIEYVVNDEVVIGGEEEETNEALRLRTKTALEASGQGTILALTNKINNISGIKSVKVLDMQRGIGTIDILVLGDILPMPQTKIDEINKLVNDTKAGGIDFLIYEPSTITTNLDITLTLNDNVILDDIRDSVDTAINDYFSTLAIGESFIRNQLAKYILNNTEDKVIDLTINAPSTNITTNNSSIIIVGTITLN